MTTAEKLFNVLASERQRRGVLPRAIWISLADQFLDVERPRAGAKPKRQLPINKMTDEQFLDFVRSEPSLAGIDINREIGRCVFHFKGKGIKPSRMRIINWLNRADKTLGRFGAGADERRAAIQERAEEPPHGWQEFMKGKMQDWRLKNGEGYEPPGTLAMEKDDFFGFPKSWREECRKALGGAT